MVNVENHETLQSDESGNWLTVPELTEILGLSPGRIRRLLEEKILLAIRVDNVLRVPPQFLRNNIPLENLSGTATLLLDHGFTNEETVEWLLTPNELLAGNSPVELLQAGRKSEVRRIAQTLA